MSCSTCQYSACTFLILETFLPILIELFLPFIVRKVTKMKMLGVHNFVDSSKFNWPMPMFKYRNGWKTFLNSNSKSSFICLSKLRHWFTYLLTENLLYVGNFYSRFKISMQKKKAQTWFKYDGLKYKENFHIFQYCESWAKIS